MELRRPTAADADVLVPLWQDPDVTRFLGGPCDDDDAAARFGNVLRHWDEHGFGLWVVEAPEPVGLCGLSVFDDVYIDLAYMLTPAAWGKGIARRAAERVLAGHEGDVVAMTQEANHASRRLLERLGFVYERTLIRWDAPQRWYVRTSSACA